MAVRTNATNGVAAINGIPPLLAISDTVNGNRARESPGEVIAHYERLADRLWLPPQLEAFSTTVLESIGSGKSTWASLTGPYGFGKTASGVLLWRHARDEGFLAIPPLSCTNYDEFAAGVAALAEEQAPKDKARVRKLFEEIWTDSLDRIARTEAKRYELPVRKVRTVLKDQLEHGRWAPDGHSHRLVEFLARLGELSARWSRGLVVIVDELQQLLGPLDVSTLSRLREFVWGMRTEQTPCAVVLTLDTQLEARLGHRHFLDHDPNDLLTVHWLSRRGMPQSGKIFSEFAQLLEFGRRRKRPGLGRWRAALPAYRRILQMVADEKRLKRMVDFDDALKNLELEDARFRRRTGYVAKSDAFIATDAPATQIDEVDEHTMPPFLRRVRTLSS